ncbi:MAG: hypothetical protein ACK4NU_06425 [Brevundimonas sp.]
MRYGLGMAGKSEESGTGGSWLASLFERLKTAVERATDMICSEEPETLDEAEKLARRAGVIARAAKLVDAIRPRVEAEDSEEDEMGGRIYDPEEDERLRRELAANCDRIEAIIESKRDLQAGGGHSETGGPQGHGERSPDRTA